MTDFVGVTVTYNTATGIWLIDMPGLGLSAEGFTLRAAVDLWLFKVEQSGMLALWRTTGRPW